MYAVLIGNKFIEVEGKYEAYTTYEQAGKKVNKVILNKKTAKEMWNIIESHVNKAK